MVRNLRYFRWIEVIHVVLADSGTNTGNSSIFNSLESEKEAKKVNYSNWIIKITININDIHRQWWVYGTNRDKKVVSPINFNIHS